MLTDEIEIKELFLRQEREIKDEVSANFSNQYYDAWRRCLETSDLTSAYYYGFLNVLQTLAVEKFIKEKYNGIDPLEGLR